MINEFIMWQRNPITPQCVEHQSQNLDHGEKRKSLIQIMQTFKSRLKLDRMYFDLINHHVDLIHVQGMFFNYYRFFSEIIQGQLFFFYLLG